MPIDDDSGFDAAAYHDRVVRPLRGRPRDLPSDLRVRYAVHRDLSGARLADHLRDVLEHWADRCAQRDYSGAVYCALVAAHEALLADPAVELTSPGWWARYRPPPDPDVSASPVARTAGAPLVRTDGSEPSAPEGAAATVRERPERDGPHDLRADRTGDEVRLSWVWPAWATEALICWEGHRRSVDREKFRQTGSWNTAIGAVHADQDVSFTVAVRGVETRYRAWSAPAEVTAKAPRLAVHYTVRRSRRHLGSRRYTVEFTTDRPPVRCEVAIGFSGATHLPESMDECTELGRAYLLSDRTSELVTVGREHRYGWLRCFVVAGQPVALTDPHTEDLRIRSWLG